VSVALTKAMASGLSDPVRGRPGTMPPTSITAPTPTSRRVNGAVGGVTGLASGAIGARGARHPKAYTTRLGRRAIPVGIATTREGDALRSKGHEFGRRDGTASPVRWFDACRSGHAVRVNVSDAVVTKDGRAPTALASVRLCRGYPHRRGGPATTSRPICAGCSAAQPVIESTPAVRRHGLRRTFDVCPLSRAYVERLEQLIGVRCCSSRRAPARDDTIVGRPLGRPLFGSGLS